VLRLSTKSVKETKSGNECKYAPGRARRVQKRPDRDADIAPSDGDVGRDQSADAARRRDHPRCRRLRRRRPWRRSAAAARRRLSGGGGGVGRWCSTSTTSTGCTTTSTPATTAPSTRAPGRSATSPARACATRSPGARWTSSSCCAPSCRPRPPASSATGPTRRRRCVDTRISMRCRYDIAEYRDVDTMSIFQTKIGSRLTVRGDGAGNTVQENSDVFCLIQMR